jgi:negative regulator of sigma E activity
VISERDEELLNRFIDGELSAEEAAEFEARLSASEDLAAVRDEFVQMGSALREHVATELNDVDFSGFFDGVIARLDPEESPAVESAPTAANVETLESGVFSSLKAWWSDNWTPVLVGAAAAAAIAFWIGQGTNPTPVPTPDVAKAPAESTATKSIVASDQPREAKPANVVVDAIRNEGNKAILVSQPVEDDGAMVIWLLDEEEEEEQPVDGEDPI